VEEKVPGDKKTEKEKSPRRERARRGNGEEKAGGGSTDGE